jgi:protein-tyrosine-phosphatase
VVNPKAIASMAELGYDLAAHRSKALQEVESLEYDAVVTMGCGDACPWVKARRRLDWQIPDPKHLEPHDFRKVRDLVGAHVRALIESLR